MARPLLLDIQGYTMPFSALPSCAIPAPSTVQKTVCLSGATPESRGSYGYWLRPSRSVLAAILANRIGLTPDWCFVNSFHRFIMVSNSSEVAPVCGQLGGLFKVYSGCRSSCQNLLGSIFLSPLLRLWVSGQGA